MAPPLGSRTRPASVDRVSCEKAEKLSSAITPIAAKNLDMEPTLLKWQRGPFVVVPNYNNCGRLASKTFGDVGDLRVYSGCQVTSVNRDTLPGQKRRPLRR